MRSAAAGVNRRAFVGGGVARHPPAFEFKHIATVWLCCSESGIYLDKQEVVAWYPYESPESEQTAVQASLSKPMFLPRKYRALPPN